MTEPSSDVIQRLTEAMAASREVVDRQLSALATTVDFAVSEIRQSATQMQQSAARIEHQVGVMSEHLTANDLKLERLADRIYELTNAVNAHLRIAEKQTDNIAELTKLVVAAQASTAATQANTVVTLINRVG